MKDKKELKIMKNRKDLIVFLSSKLVKVSSNVRSKVLFFKSKVKNSETLAAYKKRLAKTSSDLWKKVLPVAYNLKYIVLSYFKRDEILSIDLSGSFVKAVVVKREAGKPIVISAVKLERTTDHRPLKEEIGELLKRVNNCPRWVVLVSPEARFLSSELPISPDVKISSDKLQEAVRWEAEPYLDFPVSDGLFGYYLHPDPKAGGKTNTTPVFISYMSKGKFSEFKTLCKEQNLVLRRVYSEELLKDIKSIGAADKSLDVSPEFAFAADAALQELKIRGERFLGIDDRTPLIKRLKENAHFLPAVLVGIILISFMSHYLYARSSMARYSAGISRLNKEKEKWEKHADLKKKEKELHKKREYIEKTLPAQHNDLLALLRGISRAIPDDVILNKIGQDEREAYTFLLEGYGLRAGSITLFVTKLEKLKCCTEVKLKSIKEKERRSNGKDVLLYQFAIRLELKHD